MNLQYIHKEQFCHSAQSMILSDNNGNRLTIFHPGAMKYAGESKVSYGFARKDLLGIEPRHPESESDIITN